MYVAGGAALHLYTGARVSCDIDAAFSHRIALPENLEVAYQDADGAARLLYFDRQYNETFGLLHEEAHEDSVPLTLEGRKADILEGPPALPPGPGRERARSLLEPGPRRHCDSGQPPADHLGRPAPAGGSGVARLCRGGCSRADLNQCGRAHRRRPRVAGPRQALVGKAPQPGRQAERGGSGRPIRQL
jgi:hypothetical protein